MNNGIWTEFYSRAHKEARKFLFPKDTGTMDSIEIDVLQRIIKGNAVYSAMFECITTDREFTGIDITEENRSMYTPVGDIGYVDRFLRTFYGIKHMNPIEIPLQMRNNSYVGRRYKICMAEDLPLKSFSFVKSVTNLKEGWFIGGIDSKMKEGMHGMFQVSESVDFVSEFRVLVLKGTIEAIQMYNWSSFVYPDVSVIEQIVKDYTAIEGHAEAFTADVMVTVDGRTLLVEMHPFVSCGTYGFHGDSLMEMYIKGFQYYVDSNIELQLG